MAQSEWSICVLLAFLVASSMGGLPITPYKIVDFSDRSAVQGTIEHSAHVYAHVGAPDWNSTLSEFFSPDYEGAYYLECKSSVYPLTKRGVQDRTEWVLNCTTYATVSPSELTCFGTDASANGCVAALGLTANSLEIGITVNQLTDDPNLNHSFASFIMDVLAGFDGGVMEVTSM